MAISQKANIQTGETKTFKKQILRFGKWLHPNAPGGELDITHDYVNQLVDNFKKSPYVPITRGHQDQTSLEANPALIVTNNIKSLEADDQGLNATFELDTDELNKYNDVSVSVDPYYEDHETGNVIGAMLKHVALVVNPYIKGLKPFTQLSDSGKNMLINLSEIEVMDKEIEKKDAEVVETVKADENITPEVVETEVVKESEVEPVKEDEVVVETVVPQEEVQVETEPVVEPKVVEEPVVTETSDVEELRNKILELQEEKTSLGRALALKEAEAEYNALLDAGKIIPAVKDAYMKLSEASNHEINLADGQKTNIGTTLKEFFEKMPKLIDFAEHGQDVETGESKSPSETSAIKAEFRKRRPQMTDTQFEEYWKTNKTSIMKAMEDAMK